MNILLITPYVPFPLNSGGNQAFFSMVDMLRKKHRITIIVTVYHHEMDNLKELERLWPDVVFKPYYLVYGKKVHNYPKSLNGLIYYLADSFGRKKKRRTNKELSTDAGKMIKYHTQLYNFEYDYFDDFIDHVYNVANSGEYDVIQTEFITFLPLVLLFPENVRKIFVHHEIMFVRLENEISLFPDQDFDDRLILFRKKAEEIAYLDKYDEIVVLTDTDKHILGEYIDKDKIYVSPAVTQDFTEGPLNFTSKPDKEFFILGNNQHYPNYDGVLWLCNEVIPVLRQRGEKVRINVIGNWEDRIKKAMLKDYPELAFTGFVDDLNTFINDKISLVPIRIGSGMRMKILDAIKAYAPFITTSKGVEGQDFIDGKDCFIADSAEDFADKMIRLRKDVALQKSLSENAVATLKGSYNPDEMLEIRAKLYE